MLYCTQSPFSTKSNYFGQKNLEMRENTFARNIDKNLETILPKQVLVCFLTKCSDIP